MIIQDFININATIFDDSHVKENGITFTDIIYMFLYKKIGTNKLESVLDTNSVIHPHNFDPIYRVIIEYDDEIVVSEEENRKKLIHEITMNNV